MSIPLLTLILSLSSLGIQAQTYVNGNLSTGATTSTGVAAPAGYTWSEVQSGNTSAGFGANITAGLTLADNFTIGCGSWDINKLTFFGYSTGYASTTVSPFNALRFQIFNTDPSVGNPTPIYGDLTTNRFSASSNANMYRIFNASADQTRRIWRVEANITGLNLTTGTYWIEWQLGTITGVTSNFSPSSTVVGTVTQPGNNAKQHTLSSNTWINLVDGTNPQDMPFIIDYTGAACSGTPVPGQTQSTVTTVCPGILFNLSLQNCTPGTGVTYQWYSSADNVTYTPIAGATGSILSRTQTAASWYRAEVTCGGNTGTSTPVQVALTPSTGCYCIPPNTDCTDNDVILRVRMGTLDNTSSCSAPTGFTDYTSTVAATNVVAGAPNPITVNTGVGFTKAVGVWIDYNKNGQFETSEFSSVGTGTATTDAIVGTVPIPANAPLGATRMRVRLRFGATAFTGLQACTNPSAFGETEDYAVNLVPCTPTRFSTQPNNVTIACAANATFTVAATGDFPTYQWQQRTGPTAVWTTVTNGGIYSGATSATLTLTEVPQSMSGYQFRALLTGGCAAVDFSNTATLTVSPIVATVNPATAIICNGEIQQLTITNSASAPMSNTVNATGLPLAIPDANTTGVATTVAVAGIPAGVTITGVSINFTMTHTWVGDVVMNLTAPNGQTLNLIGLLDNGQGLNSSNDFTNTTVSSTSTTPMSGAPAPRTGTFRADGFTATIPTIAPTTTNTWAPLLSSTPNGNWRLAICDVAGGDVGNLTAWSITITYVAPVPATGVWSPNTGLFTDAAATLPYTGTAVTTVYAKPTTTTTYSVIVSTPLCTSAPTNIPVTVANPVTGLAVTVGDASICLGDNTTFTATTTGGNPLTYQWQDSTAAHGWQDITGATSSTYTVSDATAANTGKYRVIVSSAPCTGSSTSAPVVLTVNPNPTVTLSSATTSIVPGQTATINVASTPAGASYSWTLNGNEITGAITNSVVATIDGLGAYQATVTDVNGCTNTSNILSIGGAQSDQLWVYPNPTSGQFQVRLYSTGNPTEERVVSLYNNTGQLIDRRKFILTNVNGPYLKMDFDLSMAASGTYLVKVEDRYSKVVVSGFLIKH